MKKYLCIAVGSRGGIESINEFHGEGIEKYVEDTYNGYATLTDASQEEINDWNNYVEEFFSKVEEDWGWCLGLGEEDSQYFIDMTHPVFVEWEESLKKERGDNYEWAEVSSNDVWGLIETL